MNRLHLVFSFSLFASFVTMMPQVALTTRAQEVPLPFRVSSVNLSRTEETHRLTVCPYYHLLQYAIHTGVSPGTGSVRSSRWLS